MKKSILCIILISVFIFAAFSFSSFADDEITLEEGKEIVKKANAFNKDMTQQAYYIAGENSHIPGSTILYVFDENSEKGDSPMCYGLLPEPYATVTSISEYAKTIFTDEIAGRTFLPGVRSKNDLAVYGGKIYAGMGGYFVGQGGYLFDLKSENTRIEKTENGARLYFDLIDCCANLGEHYFDLVRTEDGIRISGGDAFEFLYSQNKYAFRLAKEGDEALLSSAASELLSHKNGIASSSLKDGVLSFKTTSGEDLSITLSDAAVLEDGGDDATIVFSVVWNRSHEGLSSTTEDNIDACLKGNCNTVELKKVNGEWKVVGGTIFNEGIIYSSNPFAPATGDGSAIFVILAAISLIAFVSISAFSVKRRYN